MKVKTDESKKMDLGSAELPQTQESQMARINMSQKVEESWNGDWPPQLGDKVRVWSPKDMRGKKVTVVATDEEAEKGYKLASPDKIRVKAKDEGGEWFSFMATGQQVMPGNLTLKQFEQQATE